MPNGCISGTKVGSFIKTTAILHPCALARTAANILVLSSSVIAKTVSALDTFASDRIFTSNPSPFNTIVLSRFSAAASAILIFFSIIFADILFLYFSS